MIAAELPTRSVPCAACGVTHSNTALCDDCAAIVARPCLWDGIEGCPCESCMVASRACGALALEESTLNVYSLPEVRERIEPAPVDVAASLPWERAYVPLATLLESAHALAWRVYGAPRVRLSTLDGAHWQVVAIDDESAARLDLPTFVSTSPDGAVAGWCELVEQLSTPALEHGPAPASLAAMECDEDAPIPFVLAVDGRVTSLATGELLGVVAPVADRAEVA